MYFWKRNATLAVFEGFFGTAAAARRGRPTHRRGVSGAGRFRVAGDLDLPPNDFFHAGRVYRATVRHGNVCNDDDAGLDIRGAALRLVDLEDPDKPALDLIMNTGEVAFSTAWVFLRYAFAAAPLPWRSEPVNRRGLRRFLESDEAAWRQYTVSLRRAPRSYTGLRYHSQIVYRFKAHDGLRRFCRFRLVPDDDAPEDGIPDTADLRAPWDPERRPGDTRDFDYLRQDFLQRLSGPDGVRYRLQLQLWEPPDTNHLDESMLDPGEAWPEERFPWRELGVVHLRRRSSALETEQLWFNLEHMPDSLDLLESFSMHDPHSVAWTRIRVYRVSQAVRSTVFWAKQRRAARVRLRDLAARGSHGLSSDQRRSSSLATLLFSHLRR